MSKWDVLRCDLTVKLARVFVARAAALWAVQDCSPGNTVGMPALRPAQRGGVRREHRMERFRRASVVSAIGSGAGAAGRAHLGSAGPAAAAPEAVALGEPEPAPEPALTRAERRGEVI